MFQNARKTKVLIVDDEEAIRSLLCDLLQDNYECETAINAEEAMVRLARKPFDIVLCDIQMPGMSGLDLLREVKQREVDVTVVMVSAVHDTRRAISALRLGAYDYIVKPFELDEVELSLHRASEHRRLILENRAYQNNLEKLVAERTKQLERVNAHLRESSARLSLTVEELYRTYRSTLAALGAALDVRDAETKGHSERVVAYSLRLGRQLKLSEKEMIALEQGALLHDIGKIGVPDAILLKPGKLTPQEWEKMRMHTIIGVKIIKDIDFLQGAIPVVGQHHEHWDGSGYSNGLKGEEIALNARIFAVADTIDAMTSDRPYRKALPLEVVEKELRKYCGTQFDPMVVDAFLQIPYEEWTQIKQQIEEFGVYQARQLVLPEYMEAYTH